jgi:excisionase family DNA binding protein
VTNNPTNAHRIAPPIEPGPMASHVASDWKPLTITIATAREISGLGNTTIWLLIKQGKLETVHVGRRTLIRFTSLEALLAPDSGSPVKPARSA